MTNSGDDRSVHVGRDMTGSQVITGDHNQATMSGTKVTLPSPDTVQPAIELAELRELLASLDTPDRGKIERALADAEEEATKPDPDRDEVGSAVDRALGYAKKASDFGDQIENVAPKVKALASWLGTNWHRILAVVGLGV
ncbi:hypothetical protein H5395_14395 [Paracoccus sp. MC1854]|uniref:hypothetical protein n=1 Tax=Paracoccus sp. MC1854 TaxID=2760306 RepID=UPI0016049B21|nr:hypothetical protein [Paracoccus sp. MC1854]MBB1492699.1 hypothetical protein [Paracoccus sp. MC1854]